MNFEVFLRSFLSILIRPPNYQVVLNFIKYRLYLLAPSESVSHLPLSLVVYLTKRCNYKCSFCFTYDQLNKSDWKEHELSVEDFSKMLSTEAGKKSLRIGLLGGEPFLNSNIFEFLKLAKKHHKITTIVTNASLVNEEIKSKLLLNSPTMLGISLYDNNSEIVSKLTPWLRKNKINFWVQTVVEATDLNKMLHVIDFAVKYKIKNLLFSNYQPSYSGEINKVIYFDNDHFQAVANEVKLLAKKHSINLTLPNLIQRNPIRRECKMPYSYIHLDSKGNVGPCCFRAPEKKYGNIYEKDFWNNLNLKKLRASFIDTEKDLLNPCQSCENLSRDLYEI